MPFGSHRARGRSTYLHLRLCCGAVSQQFQRTYTVAVGDAQFQRFMAASQVAEARHSPFHPNQPHEALHEFGRLSQLHVQQHLHSQAHLDRFIAESRRPPMLPTWRRLPHHGRIKPKRQRSTLPRRLIVG